MQSASYKTIETPIGPLTLYSVDDALVKIEFSDKTSDNAFEYMKSRFGDYEITEKSAVLNKTEEELLEYFSGKRRDFSVKTRLLASDFSMKVYERLLRIPYGQVTSYSDIARDIGFPKAFRAVGNANNKNPIPIIYPCHRVNARDGQLSGYAGGTSVKRRLQELEQNVLMRSRDDIISQNELFNPGVTAYIRSFLREDEKYREILSHAAENNIPVVKPETASLLKLICAVKRPEKILEIGTATGFSALIMADASPGLQRLLTIERDEARAKKAEENIKDSRIELRCGDALELISGIDEKFDLIFVDAAKGQYYKFLEMCLPKMREQGIMIFDNVLYKGITADLTAVKHKNRTIARNLKIFTDMAMNDDRLISTILPTGDGVLLSVLK
ncbi:MAG: methylated-DNA--[protein]-cysteine S-methyltransferase [Bacillota bacterium]|nr:methylated-DNA--[protein]-cysteine S-methyltransferase [Bacillota bacterium]